MPLILDDFAQDPSAATRWTVFSDRVMGGVSDARAAMETVRERRALRLGGVAAKTAFAADVAVAQLTLIP